jgi:hypothetical protein
MSDINGFTREFKNYLKELKKNSRETYQTSIETKIKQFKDDIEEEIKKVFPKIKEAFKDFGEKKKITPDKQNKILEEVEKVRDGIFKDVEIREKEGKTIVVMSFKTDKAKEVLKLWDFGSGTLGIPTTRGVWKKIRELFGDGDYRL